MPEGDTIFRAARTLQRALAGAIVTNFETQLPHLDRVNVDTPIVGRTVESVEAAGKWLHIRFSGELTLLTHMMMSGSWHIYRPGEPWQRRRQHMRVAIYTEKFVAVAFNVPVAEFHMEDSLRRRRGVSQLGPDLLKADFDVEEAALRLEARPELEVGVALLTQSLVAGIGNVYKSEACFVSGVHPFRSVGSLRRDEMRALLASAQKMMLANVTEGAGPAMRTTTGRANTEERLWVYRRRGEPCRKCGTAIESRKQGLDARTTFWCAECQPVAGS
jgi:endonuclease-8